MRSSLSALCALALCAACFPSPTINRAAAGAGPSRDHTVLVGTFSSDPPIDQHHQPDSRRATYVNGHWEPPGKILFVGETDGNAMAIFTRDLAEKWDADGLRPLSEYDWTYMPIDGAPFFIEVPRGQHVYLRGVTWLTNAGGVKLELPGEVELGRDDAVVYIGDIHLSGDAHRHSFRSRIEETKRAAKDLGYGALLRAPWKVRLLRPIAQR